MADVLPEAWLTAARRLPEAALPAVVAVLKVMVLPEMLLMVVPAAIPLPLTV
jgi:hypothetical protein